MRKKEGKKRRTRHDEPMEGWNSCKVSNLERSGAGKPSTFAFIRLYCWYLEILIWKRKVYTYFLLFYCEVFLKGSLNVDSSEYTANDKMIWERPLLRTIFSCIYIQNWFTLNMLIVHWYTRQIKNLRIIFIFNIRYWLQMIKVILKVMYYQRKCWKFNTINILTLSLSLSQY